MMTKTLAQEAAPLGSGAGGGAGADPDTINASSGKPEERKDLLAKIPLGRMGIPGDVASMSTFLVSDAASYVTPGPSSWMAA